MAEYIDIDTTIDVAVYQRNRRIQVTLRQILESNDAKYERADVRPVVRGKWRLYSPLTDTYECDKCGYQVIDESFRTNFCPNCGADMREES